LYYLGHVRDAAALQLSCFRRRMAQWSAHEKAPALNRFLIDGVHPGTPGHDVRVELAKFQSGLVTPLGLPARLHSLVTAIHERIFEPSLSVSKLKAACRIRDNNISSEFRYVFGMSIREYVESVRMGAVAHLKTCAVPITIGARSVGFSSVQTYYRARARRDARSRSPVQIKCEVNL
jgi:transcriptional regulator GlxA family with amidase domain